MEWSEEEWMELRMAWDDACPSLRRNHPIMRAVAARAVELVAARGGTMTADALAALRLDFDMGNKSIWEKAPENTEALLEHITAQGARVAVLEHELKDARPFEVLHADLSAQLREAWEATGVAGTVKGMATLADVVSVTKSDLREALLRVDELDAEVTRLVAVEHDLKPALSAAGQALSGHVDKTTGAPLGSFEEARNYLGGQFALLPNTEREDTAAHDDPRWTRRKKRSEVSDQTASAKCGHGRQTGHCEMCHVHDSALTDGYDSGAEAMRAACWVEVQMFCEKEGLTPRQREMLKVAIEGAAL